MVELFFQGRAQRPEIRCAIVPGSVDKEAGCAVDPAANPAHAVFAEARMTVTGLSSSATALREVSEMGAAGKPAEARN